MYDKIRKVHEQSEEKFKSNVEVSFHHEDENKYVSNVKIEVPFELSVEYRNWGINGINVYLGDTIEIPYIETADVEGEEVETDKTVSVDLSKIAIEWYPGGVYTLGDMIIKLKKDGTVDYSRSSIEVYYINQER